MLKRNRGVTSVYSNIVGVNVMVKAWKNGARCPLKNYRNNKIKT